MRSSMTAAMLALCAASALATAAPAGAAPADEDAIPPGGKYHDCHGYVRHVSLDNIRVHCIDGVAKDLSFLSWPKFTRLPSGETMQTSLLKPQTPVHVVFSQSLGVRHAAKIFVADPQGHGLYGFKG
jgi:hypothetical protein